MINDCSTDDTLAWLRANQPPQAQALTHGDFCLPNRFTDGNRFTGMIDLGDCGIADPWAQDVLRRADKNLNGGTRWLSVFP